MDYLAKNLAYLVSANGGQVAVAKRTGKDQTTISRIITGKVRDTSYRTASEAAKQFGVTLDSLINEDLETKPLLQRQSHPARLTADIIADAMGLLDELDAIAGKRPSPRPAPVRLAIACEVVSAGPVLDGKSVVVRLADRMRTQEAGDGDDEGAVEGSGAPDGVTHGNRKAAATKAGAGRKG